MPYIHLSISSKLGDDTKAAIIAEAGRLITLIPGKSEDVLMVRLDDDARLAFRGIVENCAYISVNLYLTSQFQHKQAFARAFSESVCRLAAIESRNLFLTFSEYANWAANGDLN